MSMVDELRDQVGKRFSVRARAENGSVVEYEGTMGIEFKWGQECVLITTDSGRKIYLSDLEG